MTTSLMVFAIGRALLIGYGRAPPRRIDLARANILPGRALIGWIAIFLCAWLTHADGEFG